MAACTVAIPVFNQRDFIAQAVRSALDQDIPGLEIIVVDNCSSDGTWDVLQRFKSDGVKLHRNAANIGLFGNFNRCLELSNSKYLRLLSADDRLPPRCLGQEVAVLEKHPQAVMLSSRGEFIDPSGSPLGVFAADFPCGVYEGPKVPGQWLNYYAHYRRNPLNYPSGILIRADRLHNRVRFDERFLTAGDIEFYFRALQHGDLVIADTLGSYVTRHESQTHIGPNLDGTAIKEQLSLLDAFGGQAGDPVSREQLRTQFGGMCLGLAIYRYWSGSTRDSARVHFRLARTLASGWMNAIVGLTKIVACRICGSLLGRRAPHVPVPAHPL